MSDVLKQTVLKQTGVNFVIPSTANLKERQTPEITRTAIPHDRTYSMSALVSGVGPGSRSCFDQVIDETAQITK